MSIEKIDGFLLNSQILFFFPLQIQTPNLFHLVCFLQIQVGKYECHIRKRICRSKGGLSRHTRATHPTQPPPHENNTIEKLCNDEICDIIEEARFLVKEDECNPSEITNELKRLKITTICDNFANAAKTVYRILQKSSDCKKFYAAFMEKIPLKANIFFPMISQNASVLLVLKIADCMISYKKRTSSIVSAAKEFEFNLSDKEKSALQYLAG